jgi:hypothetical protein
MAESQEHRAEQDGLALTKVAISDPAAEHRRDVHQADICAVNDVRPAIVIKPMLGQVENQQCAHAIVGKTLPHLGKEEDVEPLRVPSHFGLLPRYSERTGDEEKREHDRRDRSNPISLLPESHVFHERNPSRLLYCSPSPGPKKRHTSG